MPDRPVRLSDLLLDHARTEFADEALFDRFREGPLAAAMAFFQRRFDQAYELAPGIRSWVTIALPLFPPMAFYAARVGDHVELLDFTIEDAGDYWDTFDDDW